MKKSLSLFVLGLILSFSSYGQNVNVTFQVHNPDSLPVYVFGSWSNWVFWPGDPMTPVGNGYYAVTLSLQQNVTHEFLYVNGNTPVKEMLDPSWPCTNGNTQYTNRVLNLGSTDTVICYDWASCTTCNVPTGNVAVTFQVYSPDSVPVYVFGSWSNWVNWPGTPMASVGNGYYVTTLFLPSYSGYEYLFVNGGTPVKEMMDPSWPCTNNNPQYTNRVLNLAGADTTVCFEWESCTTCNLPSTDIAVTFRVQSPDSLPVYIFGSWNNWVNWPGELLTDVGNNTFEGTLTLNSNQVIEYLFVNGGVPIKEALDPSWPCTNGNFQYTNRITTLGNADTTLCSVWSTCQICNPASVHSVTADDIALSMGREGIRIFSETYREINRLEVYDLMGRQLYSSSTKLSVNTLIPLGLRTGSMYLVRMEVDHQTLTFKGLILR